MTGASHDRFGTSSITAPGPLFARTAVWKRQTIDRRVDYFRCTMIEAVCRHFENGSPNGTSHCWTSQQWHPAGITTVALVKGGLCAPLVPFSSRVASPWGDSSALDLLGKLDGGELGCF